MCTLLVLAGMQFVKRFQRFERVLIHGVVMIEIVLDEQADAAKLRHKTGEKADLVHQSQHVTAAPAPAQRFMKAREASAERRKLRSTAGRLCLMASRNVWLRGMSAACARANASKRSMGLLVKSSLSPSSCTRPSLIERGSAEGRENLRPHLRLAFLSDSEARARS